LPTVTRGSGLSPSETSPTDPGALPSFSDQSPELPVPIIFRATNGKSKPHRDEKIKIATVVQPDDLTSFYERYAEVCRAGMDALKKRDRSKVKKKKREQKSKEPGQPGGAKT
jgi:signal recognition particle subunit SRP14